MPRPNKQLSSYQDAQDFPTRAGEKKMAFPFFLLPSEVRTMIYKEVFRTPLGDGSITPDPWYTRRRVFLVYRRRKDEQLSERTINNGLALLQSCQQAHEEATSYLYGSHVFYFSDTQHGGWGNRIDVTSHCSYCQRLRRDDPSGDRTYSDRCYDADGYGGKHELVVPFCDFITMRRWLSDIGERNRLRIRHIQLHFDTSQFAKVLGTAHRGGKPGKPCPVGGEYLEGGLRQLALGHNLESIKMSFPVPMPCGYMDCAPLFLFSTDQFHSDRLKKALCNVTGLRTLVCEPTTGEHTASDDGGSAPDSVDSIRAGIREVRNSMTSGYETRTKHEVTTQWSRPFIDQIDRVIQQHDLACKLSQRQLSYAAVARIGL